MHFKPPTTLSELLSRRQLFGRMSAGLGGIALASLLGSEAPAQEAGDTGGTPVPPAAESRSTRYNDLLPRPPHYPARANAVIQLFMHGGPSQMDLFDPKPELAAHNGEAAPEGIEIPSLSVSEAGGLLASPFAFSPCGESGIELSEVLPNLARVVDKIALVRSMHTEHNNHEQALWMMHTGMIFSGRPALGSWVTYALGSESQNLPAYVVLRDPRGLPVDGVRNWSSGWMPPIFQGTPLRSEGTPILNLAPREPRPEAIEAGRLDLLRELNAAHLRERPDQPDLEARIASYELAARMQLAAADALDLSGETEETLRLYGITAPDEAEPVTRSYGMRCLMARRLVERGVRFVQLFVRGQIWDTHTNNAEGLRTACGETDLPVAGLLEDLERCGLLETTLVMWGGEFGRLPISQQANGRDHNRNAFSIWLAGGGVRPGIAYGATDEIGYAAAENRVSVPDLHATILHLLGLDHRRLTFRHNGRDERLTDVHEARVVEEVLA